MFYKYSTVLMSHVSVDLIEVMMRQTSLEPKNIIPALLNYNKTIGTTVPLSQNQAIRYLLFCINHQHSTSPAVHNTLRLCRRAKLLDDCADLLLELAQLCDVGVVCGRNQDEACRLALACWHQWSEAPCEGLPSRRAICVV